MPSRKTGRSGSFSTPVEVPHPRRGKGAGRFKPAPEAPRQRGCSGEVEGPDGHSQRPSQEIFEIAQRLLDMSPFMEELYDAGRRLIDISVGLDAQERARDTLPAAGKPDPAAKFLACGGSLSSLAQDPAEMRSKALELAERSLILMQSAREIEAQMGEALRAGALPRAGSELEEMLRPHPNARLIRVARELYVLSEAIVRLKLAAECIPAEASHELVPWLYFLRNSHSEYGDALEKICLVPGTDPESRNRRAGIVLEQARILSLVPEVLMETPTDLDTSPEDGAPGGFEYAPTPPANSRAHGVLDGRTVYGADDPPAAMLSRSESTAASLGILKGIDRRLENLLSEDGITPDEAALARLISMMLAPRNDGFFRRMRIKSDDLDNACCRIEKKREWTISKLREARADIPSVLRYVDFTLHVATVQEARTIVRQRAARAAIDSIKQGGDAPS